MWFCGHHDKVQKRLQEIHFTLLFGNCNLLLASVDKLKVPPSLGTTLHMSNLHMNHILKQRANISVVTGLTKNINRMTDAWVEKAERTTLRIVQ
jgi:hypothetical protein